MTNKSETCHLYLGAGKTLCLEKGHSSKDKALVNCVDCLIMDLDKRPKKVWL